MKSSRPYLIRGLYEWIVDNDCTPHLLVDAEFPGASLPQGFASDGQIVLNVSPSAVRNLDLSGADISFEGRFGGVPHSLFIPVAAVLAIYARENGQGMVFEVEGSESEPSGPDDDGPSLPPKASGRPSLKVVK